MNDSANTRAVIYRRVASKNGSESEAHLLEQEESCRRYARAQRYEVANVFTDDGVSGATVERPGLEDMLRFLRSYRDKSTHVIVDDVSRLARGVETHWALVDLISDAGGIFEVSTAQRVEAAHE